jgi:hypothetical protein
VGPIFLFEMHELKSKQQHLKHWTLLLFVTYVIYSYVFCRKIARIQYTGAKTVQDETSPSSKFTDTTEPGAGMFLFRESVLITGAFCPCLRCSFVIWCNLQHTMEFRVYWIVVCCLTPDMSVSFVRAGHSDLRDSRFGRRTVKNKWKGIILSKLPGYRN